MCTHFALFSIGEKNFSDTPGLEHGLCLAIEYVPELLLLYHAFITGKDSSSFSLRLTVEKMDRYFTQLLITHLTTGALKFRDHLK